MFEEEKLSIDDVAGGCSGTRGKLTCFIVVSRRIFPRLSDVADLKEQFVTSLIM